MKDILTREIDHFRNDVFVMSIDQLKKLLVGLHNYTKNEFHDYKGSEDPRHELVIDIERKRTIIEAELQRRGYLKKEDRADFYSWLHSQHKRRVF